MRRLTVVAMALVAAAGTAAAGMRYESETRTVDEDGDAQQVFIVTSWVDGPQARVEFREAKGGTLPGDGYLVTPDGGSTMFFVNPEEKTYMEWDLSSMFKALGDLQQASGGMVSLDFSDTSADYLGSSPGGTVLGYETTAHRMKTAFTMEMKVMGMTRRNTVETESEAWVTTGLEAAGFDAWLRKTPPTTGDAELDTMLKEMANRIDGTVLKSVATTVMTDKKGRQRRSVTTTEVTTVEETDVSPDLFEIPADFEKVEMPGAGGESDEEKPDMGGLFESIMGG